MKLDDTPTCTGGNIEIQRLDIIPEFLVVVIGYLILYYCGL